MAIGVDDVIKVAFYSRLYSQRILNVLHYRVAEITGAPSEGLWLQSAANAFSFTAIGGTLQTELIANMSLDVTVDTVRVQKVFPEPSIYYEDIIGLQGSLTGTAGTANVAASISKRTETPGRRGIGRLQLAGIQQIDYVAGILTSTAIARLVGLADAMKATVTVAVGTTLLAPILFHGPGATTVFSDVVDTQVQTTVRDMRRRTVGVGI